MTVLISSDHGGFELKQKLVTWLSESQEDLQIEDMGPFELEEDDDYPMYAFPLAEQVVERNGDDEEVLGILICRSGNGMVIAANKVEGARAALCFTELHATMARKDDFANILVLDADYSEVDQQFDIVSAFLAASPEVGGRHERRVNQIISYEQS